MEPKKVFDVFPWAKARQNPQPSSTKPKIQPKFQFTSNQALMINNPGMTSTSRIASAQDRDRNNKAKQKENVREDSQEKSTKVKVSRIKFNENLIMQDRMVKAVEAYRSKDLLQNGNSPTLRNVAEVFGVKSSTLDTRTSGKFPISDPPKVGRKPFFNQGELTDIVNHLLLMADLGYGFNELQAMNMIRFFFFKLR